MKASRLFLLTILSAAACSHIAGYLGLKDLGTLAPGHRADFIVLDADPLTDIRNVRKIAAVFIGGNEVRR